MPMLLLYCMTQDDVPSPCRGLADVGSAEVRDIAKNGVRYFYSEWQPDGSPQAIKSQALEFHKVIQKIFDHTTVIPFRFPTSVAGENELAELMAAQSSGYALELARLNGMVQMKINIEGGSHVSTTVTSGTEYLKQRQAADAPMKAAIEKIQHATHGLVAQKKQSRRGNTMHVFLLVSRDRAAELRAAVESLGELPAKVTMSGPWPPSEFANCYPEVPMPQEQPERP
jgi:hypothetical protein